jgi:hypothetical protein
MASWIQSALASWSSITARSKLGSSISIVLDLEIARSVRASRLASASFASSAPRECALCQSRK